LFFSLIGDANRDHSVDTVDFNNLAANFGQSGRNFGQGNFDYDPAGNVDTLDFNLLSTNFGKSVAGSSTAKAPPAAALASVTFGRRLISLNVNARPQLIEESEPPLI
jgi:hypothetical protein